MFSCLKIRNIFRNLLFNFFIIFSKRASKFNVFLNCDCLFFFLFQFLWFWNFFIYIRPRYSQTSHQFPDKSFVSKLRLVIFYPEMRRRASEMGRSASGMIRRGSDIGGRGSDIEQRGRINPPLPILPSTSTLLAMHRQDKKRVTLLLHDNNPCHLLQDMSDHSDVGNVCRDPLKTEQVVKIQI